MQVQIETHLRNTLESLKPSVLTEAMAYSLLSGGKRIRPRLLLSVLTDLDIDFKEGLDAATALEMIHTYSLIHDDLPSLDNDDFRRFKPTNHKVYGEANAILAGDALLTHAFSMLGKMNTTPEKIVLCLQTLSYHAGIEGMIRGQELDLLDQFDHVDDLKQCYELKTGGLFAAGIEMGVILGNRSDLREDARSLGYLVGYAFQCQDDLLEATKTSEEIGKSQFSDSQRKKMTIVTEMGLQQAQEYVEQLFLSIDDLVNTLLPNPTNMKSIIFEILNRKY